MNNEQKLGALYGYIVADALALPFRYCEQGTFKCGGTVGYGTFNQPQGTYSHNTALMLAAYDSLKVCGGHLFEDDLFLRCRWALERGKYFIDHNVFDFDHELKNVLETKERTVADIPVLLGFGLPFWAFDYSIGSRATVNIFTTNQDTPFYAPRFSAELKNFCDWGMGYFRALKENVKIEPPLTLETSSEVIEAVKYCVIASESYSSAVLKAVNLGGDTCTVASLTGALAGLKYGYSGIPIKWLETLRGRNIIDTIIR